MRSRAEVEEGVRALVADSLAVPVAEVTVDSRLVDDLGANSIDFVDMAFLVEKTFGVKVRDSELDFLLRLDFSSPDVMRDGVLTSATVARLATWLPALHTAPDPQRVTPRAVFSLLTVGALCTVIERAERAAASPPAS